jgi:hypothetical protein
MQSPKAGGDRRECLHTSAGSPLHILGKENSRATGFDKGTGRSSAMHDIKNSSHLKRKLCYLHNLPIFGVFAGHLYHG